MPKDATAPAKTVVYEVNINRRVSEDQGGGTFHTSTYGRQLEFKEEDFASSRTAVLFRIEELIRLLQRDED